MFNQIHNRQKSYLAYGRDPSWVSGRTKTPYHRVQRPKRENTEAIIMVVAGTILAIMILK